MEKIISGILTIGLVIFFTSAIGGTILWMAYEHIHALFPTAASAGIIPRHLGWWDSVCITWIFNVLIRPSSSSSSSSKD